MPRTTDTERLHRLLRDGRTREVRLAYDERDTPPWTAELRIGGACHSVRAGRSLSDAITRMQETAPPTLGKRATSEVRPGR